MPFTNYATLEIATAYHAVIVEKAASTQRYVVPDVHFTIEKILEKSSFILHISEPATHATIGRRSSGVRTFLKQLESTRVPLLDFRSNVVTREEAQPYLVDPFY